MIRINLLGGERQVKKAAASSWAAGQQLTIACSLILVTAVALVGWRFWTLRQESRRIDTAISQAQAETARMHSIIEQVQQFEQRRAQLQQRVVLIEQLRRDQTGPVHMLDQIGRALPPMVWLTRLQQGDDANDVTIEGRGTTLTGLSDFVSNLETSGYFRRSIEIVSSQSTPVRDGAGEIIQFSIRAQFQRPSNATVDAAAPASPAATRPNSAP